MAKQGITDWEKHGTRSVPVDSKRLTGTHCPNCDFPISTEEQHSAVAKVPASATWTCSHCGWTMKASYHGDDNRQPGGDLLTTRVF